MIYKRREIFENFSIKVGLLFSKIPLTPNQWTMLSLFLSFIAFVLVLGQQIFLSLILFGFAAFIDIIDGSVARVLGMVTNLGAYIDTITDRYVEFIMIFALMFLGLPDFFIPINIWLFLLLFGSIMTTYAKAASSEKRIIAEGVKGGVFEHSDRMIALILIFLAFLFFHKIYASALISLAAILANVSAVQRILCATKIAKREG